MLFIQLCFFLLHEKELLFQSLILADQSLPVTGHIREGFRQLNTKRMTMATKQHLGSHRPVEDIIHKVKSLLESICIVLKIQPFVHTV